MAYTGKMQTTTPLWKNIGYEYAAVDEGSHCCQANLIHTAASLLDKANLVKYDRKSGSFHVTDLGRVASHYYVSHQRYEFYAASLTQ